jgi:hypothetical protein
MGAIQHQRSAAAPGNDVTTTIQAAPQTVVLFALFTIGSLGYGISQFVVGNTQLGLVGMAGALGWLVLASLRTRSVVRIGRNTVVASGHLGKVIETKHIAYLSMLKSTRVSYDVSVMTNDGSVHRLATHLTETRAKSLIGALNKTIASRR